MNSSENKKRKRKNKIILFVIELIKRIFDHDITATAGFLAYNLMLAFVPFLMFLLTLIGLSKLDVNQVLEALSYVLPTKAFDLIKSTVIEVLGGQGTGIVWITIFLAIWAASNGFGAVIRGMNRAYGVKEKRGYISRVLRSIVTTVILALLIILTMVLLVFGDVIKNFVITYIPVSNFITMLWDLMRYIILVFMMVVTFVIIYKYTPAKKVSWIEAFPGAFLTSLGWLVFSSCFAFYVNTFSNYSRLYGSLGAIFILMTWLYLSSFIILLGGEVNAMISEKMNK